MLSLELDTERILSSSQHWQDLEQKWGHPVDLDVADSKDAEAGRLAPAASTCNLNRTTFDSAKYIGKLKRTKVAARRLQDVLESYDGFTEGISSNLSAVISTRQKPFYFVGGSIISKKSLEDICRDIDTMFAEIEQASFSTSTIRAATTLRNGRRQSPGRSIPSVVEHSASVSELSFDDTVDESGGSHSSATGAGRNVKYVSKNVLRCVDQLFDMFDNTF